MPKIRTHKAAKRRFRVTRTGKILHSRQGKSHLRLTKPPRVKRQYAGEVVMSPANVKRVRRLIPYA